MAIAKYATTAGELPVDSTVINNLSEADTVQGKDVRGGPCTFYSMFVTNKLAAANAAYIKLTDVVDSAFVPGTSLPSHIIPVKQGAIAVFECVEGAPFENGISMFAANDDGNDAGAVDVTEDINIALRTKRGVV